MAVVTFVNNHPTAVGVWDVNQVNHVASGMGGSITVEPIPQDLEMLQLINMVGAGTLTVEAGPVNTELPEILGTPTVGEVLTVTDGDWVGATTFTYQWLRAGSPISGATEDEYTLVEADEGQLVSCEVTGSGASGDTTVETEPTDTVAAA